MRELLQRVAAPAGHYDEVHDESGELRRHWAAFAEASSDVGPAALRAAQRRVAQQLHANGVTYNVQTVGSPSRAWTLEGP